MNKLTEQSLREMCKRTLENSKKDLKKLKEKKADIEKVQTYLLKQLYFHLSINFNLDPNDTLTFGKKKEKESDRDLFLNSIDKLLDGHVKFDYKGIIKKELLEKVEDSLFAKLKSFFK
jgi:hypothetical protein